MTRQASTSCMLVGLFLAILFSMQGFCGDYVLHVTTFANSSAYTSSLWRRMHKHIFIHQAPWCTRCTLCTWEMMHHACSDIFLITHPCPKDGYRNLVRQQEFASCSECVTHHSRRSSVAVLHGSIAKAPAKSTASTSSEGAAAAAPAKNAAVPAL